MGQPSDAVDLSETECRQCEAGVSISPNNITALRLLSQIKLATFSIMHAEIAA